ncbi:MAG TPA: chalcone isomerase family protein [Spirochaetota bacterium]|nr:chalcone isomerase family protein [Spirochaetota bacterium]
MVSKNIIAAFLSALLIFLPITLKTAEIEGVFFNDSYMSGDKLLLLRGAAVLDYMLVIRAYAGGLYLAPDTQRKAVLGDVHRILELYYFHKISAGDFRESTIEMIKKNISPDEFERISERLEKFNKFYKSVKTGDRYRAEYIPAKGTTLYHNGNPLGTVKGNDFSRAFFSIWIGADPIDKKFRDRLLGKR